MSESVRTFNSGATRDSDTNKPDYEGYLCPLVIEAFGQYMTKHRHQADGSLRASDNWQKGIPFDAYMKSLLRHVHELWMIHRGHKARDAEGKIVDIEDALSAILFNAQGYFHEYLKGCSNDIGRPTPEATEALTPVGEPPDDDVAGMLCDMGCLPHVAQIIAKGVTCAVDVGQPDRIVYIAGPMRGYKNFNFPAFDKARDDFVAHGYAVISPADIDRAEHREGGPLQDSDVYVERDVFALRLLAKYNPDGVNGIVLLPGWEKSTGARAEAMLAGWLDLKFYSLDGVERSYATVLRDLALANCI